MTKQTKEELEGKIKELEAKLKRLSEQLDTENIIDRKRDIQPWEKPINNKIVIGASQIGSNVEDTIREVIQAKKDAKGIAGLVKNTDDGSVLDEDIPEETRIPTSSIHEFTNLLKCECECHSLNKRDCMECYDHPVHLDAKRAMRQKPADEYDEAKIRELIEADKAKKTKKSWFRR